MLELVNVSEADSSGNGKPNQYRSANGGGSSYKEVTEYLEAADTEITDLYHVLKDYLVSLGDDVQEKTLKYYIAYKRIKNFACVEVHPKSQKLCVFIKLESGDVVFEEGFSRDVSNIGHFGTDNIELTIRNQDGLEKAQPLILKSYEMS